MSEEQKNIAATVKWYKADKGYGFVRLTDGAGEAFLHSSALSNLGDVNPAEGMTLVCDVVPGPRGPQVAVVHEVVASKSGVNAERGQEAGSRRRERKRAGGEAPPEGASASPPSRRGAQQPEWSSDGPATASGTVRWYNLDGQCGIIDPHDGGVGVLFDRTALRRSGIDIVADGEDVWYVARQTEDGPVADTVSLMRIGEP